MGMTYHWRPVVTPPVGGCIGPQMRHVLARRFTLGGDATPDNLVGIELGPDELDWLRGVSDGGNAEIREEAEELLAAIAAHGTIRIEVEQ